jgi:hypothetical protein
MQLAIALPFATWFVECSSRKTCCVSNERENMKHSMNARKKCSAAEAREKHSKGAHIASGIFQARLQETFPVV